ncbi:MAG TPA: nicotinate (nicotinamide) nucleotide adenylyltransferase [Bacteroidia bacterium]|nr:nicotinate (nicotinamide) nucleotide adenylyltransferase [Bacteroidia bacterium]
MKIGLFFGSFNPVHIGHMALANYMLEFEDLDQVWFVLSPQNPLKDKSILLDQNNRLVLLNLAIDDHPKMRVCTIEFNLPKPSYTVHTLAHLSEKHPEHQFRLLMGQDILKNFGKWKNYEEILRKYKILVYPRPHAEASEFDNHAHLRFTNAPLMEVSSSFIRKGVKAKKNMRFFLPPKVWEEIDACGFYR